MRSLSLRPGDSLTTPKVALSMGYRSFGFSSCLPSKLLGFWFLPRWDWLPLTVLASWPYRPIK